MKKLNLLLTCLILSTPAWGDTIIQDAEGDLEKAKQSAEGMMKNTDDLVKGAELEHRNPIAESVGKKLAISTDMAASGTSAMLAYAETKLTGDNLSELNTLVPGLSDLTDISLTMDSIDSMDKVKSAFSKAGLDASQVAEFSPIILDYLKQQGATSNLLGALSSLWSE